MEELEESFEAQNGEVTELEESFEAQNGEVTEPEESFEAQNGEVTELEVEDICDQCQSEAHVFCKQCNNSYCTTCSIQRHRIGNRKEHFIAKFSKLITKVVHVPLEEDQLGKMNLVVQKSGSLDGASYVLWADDTEYNFGGFPDIIVHYESNTIPNRIL